MAGATPSGATLTKTELDDIVARTLTIATWCRESVRGRLMTLDATTPARTQAVAQIFEKISELPREKHSAAVAVAMMTLMAELLDVQTKHDFQMIIGRHQRG